MTFEVGGDVYDRFVGRYGADLGAAFVRFAEVRPGERALDVGCGTGALTRVLADLLGPGNVEGIDPSESFVAALRERLPEVRVTVGKVEDLQVAYGSFDVVLSQLVVNFLDDPPGGVSRMRAATRPGGRVAACVWDYAGEMTMFRTFWEAAAALEPEGAARQDERTQMRFARPDELAGLWSRAGLHDVATGELVAGAAYESFDDLWQPFLAGVGPAGRYTAALDGGRQEELRAEFHRRLGSPTGPFELTARAWSVVGTA